LVDSYKESTGFSEGSGELAPTNKENRADTMDTTTTTNDVTEHIKRNVGQHAANNGDGIEEDKRSIEHELKANNPKSKSRSTPKNQNISVVFIYSKTKLTKAMENLLNRGFNFAILPLKLDLTQVLVDFKRFERSVIWHEYFYGLKKTKIQKQEYLKVARIICQKTKKLPRTLKHIW
jgi:hypothetical protein